MRDQFGTQAYFDERVASKIAHCNKYDRNFFIKRYLESGASDTSLVIMHPVDRVIVPLVLKYGRGDDLNEIHDEFFKELMLRYEYPVGLMRDGHPQKFIIPTADFRHDAHKLHSVYTMMAFCLCFMDDFEQPSFIDFVTYLCTSGLDRLADVVRGHFAAISPVATGGACPKCFDLLTQVVDAAPEQRPDLVRQHLENWPTSMAKMRFTSMAGSNIRETAETKDDLIAGMDDHYKGFWAWEAALCVKFFGIDDAMFRDNPFYPADLVHFRPPLNLTHHIEPAEATVPVPLKPEPPEGLVVHTDTPPATPLNPDMLYIRDQQHHYLYQAFVPQNGSDEATLNVSESVEGKIEFKVSVMPNGADTDAYRENWNFLASRDDWLLGDKLVWNMNDIIDNKGTDEVYPFMLQSDLKIDVGVDEPAWIHTSKHKEGKVPPLIVVRFLKFADDQMLLIECIVRDEEISIADVKGHVSYLVDRYIDVV